MATADSEGASSQDTFGGPADDGKANQPVDRKEAGYLFMTGITMGAADIVPGVSGGTMAFIMGVYMQLIDAIKAFDLNFVKLLLRGQFKTAADRIPWRFLVFLVSGIVLSMISLARIVGWLLAEHPVPLFAFFFGLVLASIVAVVAHLRWSASTVAMILVGAVFAYWLVGMVPAQTPHTSLVIFGSGAIAITAMILPGLSGSFILLILGQYAFMLAALKSFDFSAIVPFVGGMIVGILAFSRLLSWLLRDFHQITIAVLVGLMLGSLRRIWPFKQTLETTVDRHGEIVPLIQHNTLPMIEASTFIALLLCITGFVLIHLLQKLQPTRHALAEQ